MIFLHPKIASIADIYIYALTLFPSRINYLCFLTLIFIKRSQLKFPFPLNFIVSPSLTPFGIFIYSLIFLFCIPLPRQLGQNYLIFVPYPPHELHVVCITNIPCLIVCAPVPLHVLHLIGFVPGLHLLPLQLSHVIVLGYSTVY